MNPDTLETGGGFEVTLPEFFVWQEISIFCLILMDLSWGTLWVDFFASIGSGAPQFEIFIVLGISMLGSYWIYKAMNLLQLKTSIQRGAYLLFMVLVILASIRVVSAEGSIGGIGEILRQPFSSFLNLKNPLPAEFVMAIAILLFGWRGIRLTGEIIGPKKVTSYFRLGFLFLFIYTLVITTLSSQTPVLPMSIFLAAALLAMGTSRIAILAIIRGGKKSPFSWQWFFGLLLSISGALILASILAIAISNYGADVIVFILRLVLALVFLIMTPVVLVIIFLLNFLKIEASGVVGLLTEVFNRLSSLLPASGNDIDSLLETLRDFSLRWGPQARLMICSSIVLIAGLFIVFRLRAISRGKGRLRKLDLDSEPSPVGILDLLGRALRDGLSSLEGLFDRRGRIHKDVNLAAFRVRQIYAELENLSSKLGTPRRQAQTPWEYLGMLSEMFIGLETEVELITRSYIQVRYGELPEDDIDMQGVEEAWSRISRYGDQLNSRKNKRM